MDARRIKRLSDAQERRTAKELGAGRTRPGSGNKDGAKGDVITGRASVGFNTDDFLIENKFTFASKYPLSLMIWNKIAMEALRENMRTPLLQVDIAKGTTVEVRVVIMDYNDFLGMGLDSIFPSTISTLTLSKQHTINAEDLYRLSRTLTHPRMDVTISPPKMKGRHLVTLLLEDFKNYVVNI